jgi:hypothetical protein
MGIEIEVEIEGEVETKHRESIKKALKEIKQSYYYTS